MNIKCKLQYCYNINKKQQNASVYYKLLIIDIFPGLENIDSIVKMTLFNLILNIIVI